MKIPIENFPKSVQNKFDFVVVIKVLKITFSNWNEDSDQQCAKKSHSRGKLKLCKRN